MTVLRMFSGPQTLQEVIRRQKAGQPAGITSVCSANRFVIQAAMRQALKDGSCLLIEATCNQVNQFGGYTGMAPRGFARMIQDIASEMHFPGERLLLGGDHLGPFPWQNKPAEQAMANAIEMVRAYVEAGFCKLHMDASMPCLDDAPGSLSDPQVAAGRAAILCQAAEQTLAANPHLSPAVYVIGSEVPAPGGTQEETSLQVTDPTTASHSLLAFKSAFRQLGLDNAWERVIALVVQPGVEYGDEDLFEYDRQAALSLSKFIEQVPGLVYEAHSTDYQQAGHLQAMVADHFAILKVGPALTFAFREAIFALARMEAEWLAGLREDVRLSQVIETMLETMQGNPGFWNKYYRGDARQVAFACQYSRSDRIRYYWNDTRVAKALEQLIKNLENHPLPRTLISQYLPTQYRHLQSGLIANNPYDLVCDHIMEVLQDYSIACGNALN